MPIKVPATMAPQAWIRRVRSSVRCSKNDILPPSSDSRRLGGLGFAIGGFLGNGRRRRSRWHRGRWRRIRWRRGRWWRGFRRHGPQQFRIGGSVRGRFGRAHLLHSSVPLHLAHFVFDLYTEISGNAAEIRHDLTQDTRHLRKLLRAEHNQGDEENDDEMRDAEHALAV